MNREWYIVIIEFFSSVLGSASLEKSASEYKRFAALPSKNVKHCKVLVLARHDPPIKPQASQADSMSDK